MTAPEEEHSDTVYLISIFSSNLSLSTKCSLRNDDSAVSCYIPDFRIEPLANLVPAENHWILNLRQVYSPLISYSGRERSIKRSSIDQQYRSEED